MFTQEKKDKILDEKLREEYQNACFHFYYALVHAIKASRENNGYLTIKDISRAIREGIGDDLPTLVKDLVHELNKTTLKI